MNCIRFFSLFNRLLPCFVCVIGDSPSYLVSNMLVGWLNGKVYHAFVRLGLVFTLAYLREGSSLSDILKHYKIKIVALISRAYLS